VAGLVDEVAALDVDPGPGGRRRRPDQEDDEGEEKRSPQAATRSGTRTFRLNVIAPSSRLP
jgi:hypothetical protein